MLLRINSFSISSMLYVVMNFSKSSRDIGLSGLYGGEWNRGVEKRVLIGGSSKGLYHRIRDLDGDDGVDCQFEDEGDEALDLAVNLGMFDIVEVGFWCCLTLFSLYQYPFYLLHCTYFGCVCSFSALSFILLASTSFSSMV